MTKVYENLQFSIFWAEICHMVFQDVLNPGNLDILPFHDLMAPQKSDFSQK